MKPRHPAPKAEDYVTRSDFDIIKVLLASEKEARRTDRYITWEELRYRKPPEGLTLEEWWVGIRLHRMQARVQVPLRDKKGQQFSYAYTLQMQELLHRVDMQAGGSLVSTAENTVSATERNRYLLNSVMEEAIMSSMLEGAAVTRTEAKALIRSNRKPINQHERMVANNYNTMQMIIKWKDEPFTPERILSLHTSMTVGTLDDDSREGSLRTAEDKVRIESAVTGEVVHVPPPAEQLPERLQALCDFANAKDGGYIHPVLRAIILHFWLAYDHPFVDGNGRTARSLFYWSMLKAGYWLFEYISVSREIYNHARSYYRAFMSTEEDSNDLNYFIADQLETMCRAVENLQKYVNKKQEEQAKLQEKLRGIHVFNHRQKSLISHFMKHPEAETTVLAQCDAHKIVRQTARTDLQALQKAGLLDTRKEGNEVIYFPVSDFSTRLTSLNC